MNTKQGIGVTLLSLVLYVVLVLFVILKYAPRVQYQVLVAAGVVNLVVLTALAFTLRRKWISGDEAAGAARRDVPDVRTSVRIRKALWGGAVVYCAVFVRGLYYGYASLGKLPTSGIAVGKIVNASILVTVVWCLRKTYTHR